MVLLLFTQLIGNVEANPGEVEKVEAPKSSPVVLKRESNLKNGVATSDEKKFLAQEYLKTGKGKEASTLYEEINDTQAKDINSLVNMGTSYASSGNLKMALESYENAIQIMPEGLDKDKLKDALRSNILVALKKQKKKKQEEKKKKKNKDKNKDKKKSKDKNKDKENKDDSGEGSTDSKNKEKQDKDKGNEKKKKKPKEENKQDKKDKEKAKEEKEDKEKADQKKEEEKRPSTLEEKEKDIKRKRKLVKIPAMLKQIMDQDRNLQEQYYRTNQKRKRKNNDVKDW